MAFDFSKVVSELGDDLVAQCGEPVGLNKDQSVRVARALGQHMGGGKDLAIKAAAADTGLSEEVTSAMLGKLIETGKDKLINEGPVGDAIEGAKTQAMAAMGDLGNQATKGIFGKLFGKK